MKLPNCNTAIVPERKVVEYLLSASHSDGRHKAAYFRSCGFEVGKWQVLAEALCQHAQCHEVARQETSPFGVRYIIEGIMRTPDGRTPRLRSIWFMEHHETVPRFVTAYPLKRNIP